MNTTVIHHAGGVETFRGLRVKTASRRISATRRFRIFIELSDWDESAIRYGRKIDAFCWLIAGGTAALLVPVCFLVVR
ncbi:MAG TPA: hypothetical protein VMB77_15085 [Syntrophales bacterium]|nr:hypothetical protein [Syntrophales bacterium]